MQLFRPLSRQHRSKLQTAICSAHTKFQPSSGHPLPHLQELNLKVQEALEIEVKVPWEAVGIPMIDALSQRNYLLAQRLGDLRDAPDDLDDSAVFLGKLIAEATDVVNELTASGYNWITVHCAASQ